MRGASRGVRPELTTKTFNPMAEEQDHGLARTRMSRQIESSLDRLGVAGVDLYLAHDFDPDVPGAETEEALLVVEAITSGSPDWISR